jgi:DNA adenine methylase
MQLMRYPGGKAKIKKIILSHLKERYNPSLSYIEPFFGGGSIGLNFLKEIKPRHIWINDADYGLWCLWMSVINKPEIMKKKVMEFTPSVDAFYEFRDTLLAPKPILCLWDDICEYGFKKLALHQISYSGLGTKSGGPLGGKEQKSKYKINSRWSAANICKKINRIFDLFSGIDLDCTNTDFEHLLNSEDALIFLDPPYYEVGNSLYQCGFTIEDHVRLSNILMKTSNRWVLTYDDHPEIRNLYSWAKIEEISMTYTIVTKNGSRNKVELLITPR